MVLVKNLLKGLEIKNANFTLVTDNISNKYCLKYFQKFVENFLSETPSSAHLIRLDGRVNFSNKYQNFQVTDVRSSLGSLLQNLENQVFQNPTELVIFDDLMPILLTSNLAHVARFLSKILAQNQKIIARLSTDFVDSQLLENLLKLVNLQVNLIKFYSKNNFLLDYKILNQSYSGNQPSLQQSAPNCLARVRLRTQNNRIVSEVLGLKIDISNDCVKLKVDSIEVKSHLEKKLEATEENVRTLPENLDQKMQIKENLAKGLEASIESAAASAANEANAKPKAKILDSSVPISTFNLKINAQDEIERQKVQLSYMNVDTINSEEGLVEYVPDSDDDFDDSDPDDDLDF